MRMISQCVSIEVTMRSVKRWYLLVTSILVIMETEAGYHYQPNTNPVNHYHHHQHKYHSQNSYEPQSTYYNVRYNKVNQEANNFINYNQPYRSQELYNQHYTQNYNHVQIQPSTQYPQQNHFQQIGNYHNAGGNSGTHPQQNPINHIENNHSNAGGHSETYPQQNPIHQIDNYHNNAGGLSGTYPQQNTIHTTVNEQSTSSGYQQTYHQPTIKKHVYFHVPPPDLEPRNNPSLNLVPKKNYKIIFIKVPSQNTKTNQLREQIINAQYQQHPIEEKTLIYVLVKKPEAPETFVHSTPVHSNPEVFYVKYKQNSHTHNDNIATEVNAELAGGEEIVEEVVEEEHRDIAGVEEVIQPGLVNGQAISYEYVK